MTVKRITLKKPGGLSWVITADGPIPDGFKQFLDMGVLMDIPEKEDPAKRHHIAIQTFAGPVHALTGHVLIRTDADQVFAMTPGAFEEVWQTLHD